jgi:hypothetical protein
MPSQQSSSFPSLPPRRRRSARWAHLLLCCLEIERFECRDISLVIYFSFDQTVCFSLLLFRAFNLRRHHDLPISCIGGTEQLKITLNLYWSLKRGEEIPLLSVLSLAQRSIEFPALAAFCFLLLMSIVMAAAAALILTWVLSTINP